MFFLLFLLFFKPQRRRGRGAAKTYERPGLSKEEIEEIREAFNLFDTDGSGMHLRSPSLCPSLLFKLLGLFFLLTESF